MCIECLRAAQEVYEQTKTEVQQYLDRAGTARETCDLLITGARHMFDHHRVMMDKASAGIDRLKGLQSEMEQIRREMTGAGGD